MSVSPLFKSLLCHSCIHNCDASLWSAWSARRLLQMSGESMSTSRNGSIALHHPSALRYGYAIYHQPTYTKIADAGCPSRTAGWLEYEKSSEIYRIQPEYD